MLSNSLQGVVQTYEATALARQTRRTKHVCQKDKEFQSWLSDQHTKTANPTTKGESFQLELK